MAQLNRALRPVFNSLCGMMARDILDQLVWYVLRTPEYRAVNVSKREHPKDVPPSFL
jgi:hypothetical protein